jgi:imidazolonepropionase-like amidohydrolase
MGKLVLTNVNVLDGVRPAQPGRTVVIDGDRIAAVSGGLSDPVSGAGAVIDLEGRTLMPGMATCHFHSTYEELGSVAAPYGSEHPPAYLALVSHKNLLTALRWGYTTVVGAGGSQEVEPGIKLAIERGLVPGPRFSPSGRELSTTGHANDGVPWYWNMPPSGAVRLCDGADGFRIGVREEVKRGAEVVKLFVTGGHGVPAARDRIEMSRGELEAAIETAHERGVLIRGHLSNKKAIIMAIELGIDIVDHCDEMDDDVIAACVERGTYVVPSIYFSKVFAPLFPGNQAELAHMYEVLPKAEAAGVRLLLGDDYGAMNLPHGSYGGELHTYVEDAGIAPQALVRWATVNAQRLLGRDEDLGTVEAGKLADLLVIDGDPSFDIGVLADRPPLAVIKSGEVVAGVLPNMEDSCRVKP